VSTQPPESDHLSVSTRDEDELRERLGRWLASRPDVGPGGRIDSFQRPDANGMSSETLLFDASWSGGSGRYVVRMSPADDAFPVFPAYDLERQVRAMQLVGERSKAPVPAVRWYEPDEAALGAPFFVMDRVDGMVPPDVMPYDFDGTWVSDASAEDRARLQASSVDVLAEIHGVAATATDDELAFLGERNGTPSPLRRHFAAERDYYDWVRGEQRFPVLERSFDWLEDHWPTAAEAAPPVLCWGDARIGNVLYRDFEPVGVLDWEMATIGPRELDVSWLVFAHKVFESITGVMGMPGMPGFLREADVVAHYESLTGVALGDLHWFHVLNGVRWSVVFMRTGARQIHFGEIERPDDIESLMFNKPLLEDLLAEVGA
jgi:aminoglycoside phosphotransferase (APT) family kinase protein